MESYQNIQTEISTNIQKHFNASTSKQLPLVVKSLVQTFAEVKNKNYIYIFQEFLS